MLFAVCNPAIAAEAQIGLALRILCGFGIDEIADAFLSNKETINKRLFRAKEKLRVENIKMELPPPNEIEARLNNVLHIIYLLFNEGYYSRTQNQVLRKELCLDAIRLGAMLTEYDKTNRPKTNALLALMCFHSSRFGARQNADNSLVLFGQQNPDLWDMGLVKEGFKYLDLSAQGEEVSSYHLEAKIAGLHCIKEDTQEKWENILHMYNQLLLINYSPAVALNRTFALYKAHGKRAALAEAEKLKLESNHFYHILLGELYQDIDNQKAIASLKKAHDLANSQTEKQILQMKIYNLQ
jgi:RNA polymerase sigma-70 factor (ECF subfamily)